jgi:hypothetical protein
MSIERNTKFAGFAKALWPKLQTAKDPEVIIAQAAYDLVYHAFLEADLDDDYYDRHDYDTHKVVGSIPDLTELK